MSASARQAKYSGQSVGAFSDLSRLQCKIASPMTAGVNRFTAFSFEFVAKPEKAANAARDLPEAIPSALEDIAGFGGSLVMVSDLEARLITVITFWQGSEARRSCAQSVRRVSALLAPYLDRCLRAQNLLAHLPTPQALSNGFSSIDTSFITSDSMANEADACVAWHSGSKKKGKRMKWGSTLSREVGVRWIPSLRNVTAANVLVTAPRLLLWINRLFA